MQNDLLEVCRALQEHGVRYILVGGHAVRLNGIVRATEDVDILVPFDIANGRRLIEGLGFLESARDIDPAWFSREANEPEVENVRVADRIVVDILFAVNGETFESLQPHVRMLELEGVEIPVLDIDGLLKAKTDYREKDVDMSELMETQPWSKSDGLLSWTMVGQPPVIGVGRPQRPFPDSVSRFAQGS